MWRCEGPHCSVQKRPRTFASALQSVAAVEASKNLLSRDFWCRSIFDFCNNIGTKRTCRRPHRMSGFGGWSQPVDATLYLTGEIECAVMDQRFHRGFTAAEKTELWDRWKRGESLKAIGRAFGKQSSSIYFLVAPHGGFRPAERRRSRLALTLAEREVISRGVAARRSARSIAKLLGRSPSTVSREMSR